MSEARALAQELVDELSGTGIGKWDLVAGAGMGCLIAEHLDGRRFTILIEAFPITSGSLAPGVDASEETKR